MKRSLVLVALACLILAGCTSLPRSSAPAPFDVSSRDGSGVQFSAEGPADGSDAATLVNDFLLACAASQVDVTVSVLGVASVDSSGVLTRVDASTASHTFTLVREDGQWRINAPDNMVLMSRAAFTASYSLVNLYFPTVEGSDLVADPRWYPSRRLASYLLAGLVAGPSQALAPVTANAIPAGTTIPSHGVDVSDGVAHVELNAVMPASEGGRESLAWELTRTLTQATDVSQVSVSLSGETLEASAPPAEPTYSLDTLVGAGPDGVGIVSGTTMTMLASVSGASSPTASPVDPSLIAWSSTDGVYAQRAGTSVAFIPGTAPAGPSIDRFGWVWGASTSAASVSVAGGADGVFPVSVESEGAGDIRAVRISPDGVRALVIRGADSSAWVGVVERGPAGRPQAVRSLTQVSLERGTVIDGSWTTSTGLALVVREAGSSDDQLVTLPLGGLPSNVSLPIRVRTMSAGASSSSIVITGTDDAGKPQVLIRSGALWQNAPDPLTSARYAG